VKLFGLKKNQIFEIVLKVIKCFHFYEYVEYLVQVTGAINFLMQKQNAQEKMLANIIKIKK